MNKDVGIGYTLATGNLYCEIHEFHKFAEELMGYPIFTHEFANKDLWKAMRRKFETKVKEEMNGIQT